MQPSEHLRRGGQLKGGINKNGQKKLNFSAHFGELFQ